LRTLKAGSLPLFGTRGVAVQFGGSGPQPSTGEHFKAKGIGLAESPVPGGWSIREFWLEKSRFGPVLRWAVERVIRYHNPFFSA
jgi:hypothetical protein